MLLSEMLIYIWVIAVSSGVIINTIGEKAVLALVVGICLIRGKFLVNKRLLIIVSLFGVFILLKSIGVNINRSGDYHGLWTQYVRIIELMLMLPMVNSIIKDIEINKSKIIRNCIKLFNIFFYFTIIVTIFMLFLNGRGYYRDYAITSPIYAPQSFLMYSIALAIILTSKILYKKGNRVVNILKLAANGCFVFMMNYTTQMLFFLIVILAAIIAKNIEGLKKKILFLVSLVLLGVIIVPVLPYIIENIKEGFFAENKDVSMRLVEISNFLKSGDLSGKALGGRVQVMLNSWNTFLTHPLVGVPFSNYNYGQMTKIGGHHEWIDNLAKFGLIGCFLFALMLYEGFKNLILVDCKMRRVNICLVGIFIIYGFFNPVINMTIIIVAVMSRYALYYFFHIENEENYQKLRMKNNGYYKKNLESVYKTL